MTAKWERDVLVVDTAGFNDRIWVGMNNGRMPHTEMLHMTERYRRVDFGYMEIKVTFEDPATFAKPFVMDLKWDLAPQEELLEFVCENNRDWVGLQPDEILRRVSSGSFGVRLDRSDLVDATTAERIGHIRAFYIEEEIL